MKVYLLAFEIFLQKPNMGDGIILHTCRFGSFIRNILPGKFIERKEGPGHALRNRWSRLQENLPNLTIRLV